MTLNGVMALILRYFTEFVNVNVLISRQQILSREMSCSTPHDGRAGLFAVATSKSAQMARV